MVRYELTPNSSEGSIRVAYGRDFDPIGGTGAFLLVYDSRLAQKYDGSASKEVNETCRAFLCLQESAGCYIAMYTGPFGMGRRVSMETMAVFFQRYGVPTEHIAQLLGP